jgi:hypothetical protein
MDGHRRLPPEARRWEVVKRLIELVLRKSCPLRSLGRVTNRFAPYTKTSMAPISGVALVLTLFNAHYPRVVCALFSIRVPDCNQTR